MNASPLTLSDLRSAVVGRWVSLSVELRPTEDRTGSGSITPTFLTRIFTYHADDTFEGIIRLFGDPWGQLPLLQFEFRGHLKWGGPHPIASGAFEIDYVLDRAFLVTPLHEQAAAMLNAVPAQGLKPFRANEAQDILQKAFPMFNIAEGQTVIDYDLLLLRDEHLYFGAKHVDGTPFDRSDRRPQQLQVPLIRG